MQIHKIIYGSSPNPKNRRHVRKMALHIHDGIAVASPKPPQTPPIILSLDDFLAFFKFCHVLMNASDDFSFFPNYCLYGFRIRIFT
jgi:hypothetical protein